MSEDAETCPKCGARTPRGQLGGYCVACLFQAAVDGLAEPPEDLGAGSVVRYFGDYEILDLVSRGGMGVVYKAKQRSLNRIVALKMVLGGEDAKPEMLRRFRVEAEAAANLSHPNIVQIYEVGREGGKDYLAMQFVEGPPLDKRMRQSPLTSREAAQLVELVARAIHHAHQHGVLHRDIKPSNILLERDGQPKVADFGLAKIMAGEAATLTLAAVGTPSYAAPEQARGGGAVSTAADVYSLGAVLYELLSGSPPFAGGTALETLHRVIHEPPRPPSAANPACDPDLEVVALKCLEKEPAHRYPSALALAEDLERWLRGEPIQARPAGPLERAVKWARRHPALATMAALLAATFIGGVVGVMDQWRRASAAQESAAGETARANLAVASTHLERGNVPAAKQLLIAVPPRFREWEWGWLAAQAHPEAVSIKFGRIEPGVVRPIMPQMLFSPDGPLLAAWDSDRAALLRSVDGSEVVNLHAEQPSGWKGPAFDIHFSPDSRRVLAHGPNGSMVMDLHSGERWLLPADLGSPLGLAAGDMALLWSQPPGGRDAGTPSPISILGINYLSGQVVGVHQLGIGFGGEPWLGGDAAVALSTRSLWPRRNPGVEEIHAVESASGRRLATLHASRPGLTPIRLVADEKATWGAALWPDGSVEVVGGDFGPPRQIAPPDADRAAGAGRFEFAAESRPNGRWLVIGRRQETLRLISADTGRETLRTRAPCSAWRLSPDGETLATLELDWGATLWRTRGGTKVKALGGHGQVVVEAQFSPDSKRLATMDLAGEIKIWAAQEGREKLEFPDSGVVLGAAMSPSGAHVATAHWDRVVRVWNTRSGQLERTLRGAWQWMMWTAWSPDGKLVAGAGVDRSVVVWRADSGEVERVLRGMGGIAEVVAFSPDSKEVVAGSADGAARVWNVGTGRLVQKMPGTAGEGMTVGWSPDGRLLARASLRNNLAIWERDSGEIVLEGRPARVVAWHPRNETVAAGGEDGEVTLWSLDPKVPARSWKRRGQVRGLAYSTNGQRLFIARSEGRLEFGRPTVEVCDAESEDGQVLLAFDANGISFNSASYAPNGDSLFTTMWDGGKLWEVLPWKSPKLAVEGEALARELRLAADLYWRDRMAEEAVPQTNSGHGVLAAQPWDWPGRAESTPPQAVDLGPFYNFPLHICPAKPRNTYEASIDYRLLPPGTYHGSAPPGWVGERQLDVPLDVRALVVLGGGQEEPGELRRFYPSEIRGIPIRAAAKALHFLHGTAEVGDPAALGRYVVRHADGTTTEIPLQFGGTSANIHPGANIHFWGDGRADVLWRHDGIASTVLPRPPLVHHYRWANPNPDKAVESIDIEFHSTGEVFFLMALSVEP